jgi:hypothetical protein
MLFLIGIQNSYFEEVKKAISKALPSTQVAGLPADAYNPISSGYVDQCLETMVAFHQGRPKCFDDGLSVLVLVQQGDSFDKFSAQFYPFALLRVVEFERRFSQSGAQLRRDKNEIARILEAQAKSQVALMNKVTTYTKSRVNRSPLLLPLRHFNEQELSDCVAKAWVKLQNDGANIELLDDICEVFEQSFAFAKKEGAKSGLFVNSKSIEFKTPGRALHGFVRDKNEKHRLSCFLNGLLRIGGVIVEGFHYDCTNKGKSYSGKFSNCHDIIGQYKGNPHLNVYPDDYIR